ncbi:MAG: hypothetical protein O2970_10315 [Proteobacteria bacterium]|nr:hypothetical protein [Pseudomonadota bacterium]MDA0967335.1 hypothetical protein [Pseudomonadota bacterium]
MAYVIKFKKAPSVQIVENYEPDDYTKFCGDLLISKNEIRALEIEIKRLYSLKQCGKQIDIEYFESLTQELLNKLMLVKKMTTKFNKDCKKI